MMMSGDHEIKAISKKFVKSYTQVNAISERLHRLSAAISIGRRVEAGNCVMSVRIMTHMGGTSARAFLS